MFCVQEIIIAVQEKESLNALILNYLFCDNTNMYLNFKISNNKYRLIRDPDSMLKKQITCQFQFVI